MFIFSQLRELGDAICRAVTCFLCLGPVLALVGIGFLAATSVDSRSAEVSTFNAASSSWSNGGAAAFAAVPFSLVGPAGTLALTLVSTLDAFGPDSASLSLPNMTSRWAATTWSGHPFSYVSPGSVVTVPATLAPGGSFATSSLSVPLFRTATMSISCKSSESSTTCSGRCNGGYWNSNSPTICTKFFKLSSVCVVVNPSTRQVDSAGGAGCEKLTSGDAGYNPATFAGGTAGSQATLGMYNFISSSSAFPGNDFSGVQVTVRASTDPYVMLLRSTGGSLAREKLTNGAMEATNIYNRPGEVSAYLIASLVGGVMIGLSFLLPPSTMTGYKSRITAIFFMVSTIFMAHLMYHAFWMVAAGGQAYTFRDDMLLGRRTPGAFILAHTIVGGAVYAAHAFVIWLPVYFLTGMMLRFSRIVLSLLVAQLANLALTGLVVAMSAAAPVALNMVLGLYMGISAIFSGVMVPLASMPVWLSWIGWISVFYHTMSAMMQVELIDNTYNCAAGDLASVCANSNGDTLLLQLGITDAFWVSFFCAGLGCGEG